MEGLIVVGIVIFAILSSVSKSQKAVRDKKTQESQDAALQTKQPPRPASGGQQVTLERYAAAKKKKAPQQQMSQQRPQMEGSLGGYTPMQSREGLSDYTPLKHRLDTSGRHTEYTGSMGGMSTEGRDTCDPSLGHEREDAYHIGSVLTGEIGNDAELNLRFDKPALINGIVMSEILAKPSQRKWGRR